jgi:hypothetical protein
LNVDVKYKKEYKDFNQRICKKECIFGWFTYHEMYKQKRLNDLCLDICKELSNSFLKVIDEKRGILIETKPILNKQRRGKHRWKLWKIITRKKTT